MRMVSNRHIGASMKRFKRIHVQHKVYIAPPSGKNKNEEIPVVKAEETIIPEFTVSTKSEEKEITETPKPKRRKKKDMTETVKNNEEKPENNG